MDRLNHIAAAVLLACLAATVGLAAPSPSPSSSGPRGGARERRRVRRLAHRRRPAAAGRGVAGRQLVVDRRPSSPACSPPGPSAGASADANETVADIHADFSDQPEPRQPGTDVGLYLDCVAIYSDCNDLDRLRDAIDQHRKEDTP
jgi:hypothetical protein